jgi:hypothetical protein
MHAIAAPVNQAQRQELRLVVLDLLQPWLPEGSLSGFAWEARREEPGEEGTLQHGSEL